MSIAQMAPAPGARTRALGRQIVCFACGAAYRERFFAPCDWPPDEGAGDGAAGAAGVRDGAGGV
jgi:hypothetical protein